jgi:uncharacterized PurR-regulated membrane protein YhhQ (DUF165 family)
MNPAATFGVANRSRSPRYYPLLLAIVLVTQCMGFVYAQRKFSLFGIDSTCSGVIFPIIVYAVETIGECYGYEYARQTVYINLCGHLLVILYCALFYFLPMSDMNANDMIAYHYVINNIWFSSVAAMLGNWIGDQFSAKYIPLTKLLFRPSWLMMRLFVIHVLSEFINISVAYTMFFVVIKHYTLHSVILLIFGTLLFKSIIALILLPAVRMVISFIKQKEGFENNDKNQDYKWFRFFVDDSKIESIDTAYFNKHKPYADVATG